MIAVHQIIRAIETKMQETAMPLKPRIKVKAKGIPIGNFDVVQDAAGRATIAPKKKHRTLQQQYASKNRKTWKGAK